MSARSGLKRFTAMIRGHPLWVLALILIAMPYFSGNSWAAVTHVLIFGLLALAYNFLLGQTGIMSFGHALFFGLGAYGAGMFLVRPDPNWYPTTVAVAPEWAAWISLFLVGPLLAAAVAVPCGILALRRAGTYFALITIGYAMMAHWFFLTDPLLITAGGDGLMNIPNLPIFGLDWRNRVTWYYLCMIIFLAAVYVLRRLSTSPFGEVLKGIRDDELRVKLLGYNTERFKLLSFVVSAMFTGLAGALYCFDLRYVGPPVAHWMVSAQAVVMTLIGGVNLFFGPLFGAYIFIFVKDWLVFYTLHWQLVLGAIIMGFLAGGRGLGVLEMLEKLITRLHG